MQVGIPSNQWSSEKTAGKQAGSAQGGDTLPPAPSIPMYLAGLVVTYAGLHAANLALGDPSFSALIVGLTLIGFAASYITRRQNIAPRNVELPALIVCVCVVLMAVITDPADSFLAPASVAEDRSKALALLLTWLTVFRSFTLTSDAALLFCCVPTIALIGLIGTATSDSQLSTIFLTFVAAAIFMMVHENVRQTSSQQRDRTASKPASGGAGRTAAGWKGQLQATAACTVLAMVMANFATPFFQAAGSFVRVSSGLNTLRPVADRVTASRSTNEQRPELEVATGPVSLSDEPVFTVQAKESAYWRGPTFDNYTGLGWRNLNSSTASPLVDDAQAANPNRPDQRTYRVAQADFTPRAKRFHELDQHVKFVGSATAIYGAGEIRSITLPMRNVLADRGGSLRLTDPLASAEYDVHSEIADLSPAARRAVPGGYPEEVTNSYTQLGAMRSDARAKVTRQAVEITESVGPAYQKVEALSRWISQQCKYNTSTPGYPRDRDVVDYFLFDAKQGYCDSFATSLAVMCRAIDIPARVVSGYLPGDLDHVTNTFTVRDKHKHLWTEVYFNDVGWVGFDATSAAVDVTPLATTQTAKKDGFWALLFSHGWWPPTLLGVVVALLLYVLKVEVIDRYLRPRRDVTELGLPETNYSVLVEYENGSRALARLGIRRLPAETASEYLARTGALLEGSPAAVAALTTLTDLAIRYRYSAAVATSADVQQAQQCAAAISQALRGTARRSLALTPAPESA